MTRKLAKTALPLKDTALDALVTAILAYAGPRIEGVGGGQPEWGDISIVIWMAFKAACEVWTLALAACKVPHVPAVTEAKNDAKAALLDALAQLIDHGLVSKPRTAADVLAMGFQLRDGTYSPVGDPETVPLIVSLTSKPGQIVVIHFKDTLSDKSEAIPHGMGGCVLNFTYGPKAVTDKSLIKERLLMTHSPYVLKKLPPEAQQQVLSCYGQWQTEGGDEGKPGDVSSVVIV
jgi:hypothetical protein